MVNKPRSQALSRQIWRKEVDDLKAYATKLYMTEQEKPPGEKKKSACQICKEASDTHYAETKRRILLAHNTLARHGKGGLTLTQSNAQKSWLTADEEENIVKFAIEIAQRGFLLSPRRLKDHCEAILRHRLGSGFPEKGLGRDWGSRFITKHHNRLGMYWSSALDGSRGRAVNPVTKEEYFRLLKEAREKYNIPDELVYGADETGIQSGIGVTERVIGPAGVKIQHQQRSGTRENITVLPTICADGTSIAPTVIYKGEAFQTKWLQDNPLDARYDSCNKGILGADFSCRMGYQKKGYTSGEIGVAWLKDWDRQTTTKANGRTRLLVVDGHSSHYTLGFLEYARDNNIVVLCYPSHSTHVYQGLDVVIFSVLKHAWSDERDKFEAQGPAVTKLNFMAVYARAHVRTFTERNIRAAFAKTGIAPYNPDVITTEMMAPSLETSTTSLLPLGLASPLREVVDLISHHNARKWKRQETEEAGESPQRAAVSPASYTPVRRGLASLATTSAAFLVSNSPILSNSTLPPLFTIVISPPTRRDGMILDVEPCTEHEARLQEALYASNTVAMEQKQVIERMQAQTVLQSMYLEGVRGQLQAQEEKKTKKRKTGKINVNGRAKILTQADIIEGVKDWQDGQDKAVEAAGVKKKAKEWYSAAMDIWKVQEMDRKKLNAELKGGWEADVKLWMVERDSAKYDHRKARWTKPKMPPMGKALRKPLLADFTTQDSGGEEEDEEEDSDLSEPESDLDQ
jgi:hypothetical protein